MDAATKPSSYELSAYGALVRRRWRLVAAGALVGLVLPGIYLVFGPKTYTSTTRIIVEPIAVSSPTALEDGISNAKINLDTEAQIATSLVVAKRARKRLDTSIPPKELLEHVDVNVPPNSSVLAISYDARTPEQARAGASAFAKAYLANRNAQAEAELRKRTKNLRRQARTLRRKLEKVTDRLSSLPPGSGKYAYAQSRKESLTGRLSSVNAKLGALRTITITPGRIISAAQLPTAPSSPIIPLWLAGGLMAGLLLGLTGAVLRDRSDTRIRDAGDVERLAGLPVLMEVPGKPEQVQPTLLPPRTRAGQAFHGLSHSLSAALGNGHHVLLVTGASPGAGTSTVAANLAATLARTGSNTVLVCADLPSTTSTWMLGLAPSPGLSDVLLRGSRNAAVEQRPAEPSRLRVLAPGLDTEAASERLQTRAMERLAADLRQSARYVVVEAPSTAVSADAEALADIADAAIIVAEVPRTEREQVREGVRRLDRVGAVTLGAVVVPSLEMPEALMVGQYSPAEQHRPDINNTGPIHLPTQEPAHAGQPPRAAPSPREVGDTSASLSPEYSPKTPGRADDPPYREAGDTRGGHPAPSGHEQTSATRWPPAAPSSSPYEYSPSSEHDSPRNAHEHERSNAPLPVTNGTEEAAAPVIDPSERRRSDTDEVLPDASASPPSRRSGSSSFTRGPSRTP